MSNRIIVKAFVFSFFVLGIGIYFGERQDIREFKAKAASVHMNAWLDREQSSMDQLNRDWSKLVVEYVKLQTTYPQLFRGPPVLFSKGTILAMAGPHNNVKVCAAENWDATHRGVYVMFNGQRVIEGRWVADK